MSMASTSNCSAWIGQSMHGQQGPAFQGNHALASPQPGAG
jgi:hypothetical protein